jgi:hypothetical protein
MTKILLFTCACCIIYFGRSVERDEQPCYSKDCPPTYIIADIEACANRWDPFNVSDSQALGHLKRKSMHSCLEVKQTTTTGGWCLQNEKTRIVELPNNQSYRLPIPQHVEADDLIVEQLNLLLKQPDGKYLTLIDFGAGVGQYGHALLAMDQKHRYTGYDGAGDVEKFTYHFLSFFDFTIPLSLTRGDWLLCLEVGEHIPHNLEGAMIRNLHAHNKKGIILSWGVLNQNGHHHINNHSKDYLINIFSQLGYIHDVNMSHAFSIAAPGKTYKHYYPWFRESLIVFRRKVELTV